MGTILPNGEEISVTPDEVLKYLNPDGLRQMLRQERIRWNLKPNKDVDYIDKQRLFKYTGALHNNGAYQKMEIRTYPDNGAIGGYAGVYVDSGVFGIAHNLDKWNGSLSDESKNTVANRAILSASGEMPDKSGHGLDNNNNMSTDTSNRMAAILVDPVDGRAYHYSNDDTNYVNNSTIAEEDKLPDRTIARVCDIPTNISQLNNDIDMVCDPDYHHTDNNYTNSNRFILDNLDDRTFVYPEISKDSSGDPVENYRIGLNGKSIYGESDGIKAYNDQPDLGEDLLAGKLGDRFGEKVSSYNHNKDFSGAVHNSKGYMPGIFRSIEELERVDLVDQHKLIRTHQSSPGGLRDYPYYINDGVWTANWSNFDVINESYKSQPQNPTNMEMTVDGMEPVPYSRLAQSNDPPYTTNKLYQWRYNRIDVTYRSEDIVMDIVASGENYKVGDRLVWPFGDDIFTYVVDMVGANGQIQKGHYQTELNKVYDQSPETRGVGIPFRNTSGVGFGAKLSISCVATIHTFATQIKNNLYALVDVVPTVRSDNTTEWSDVNIASSQDGKIVVRSTAAGPAYSGINSGRGGPSLSHGSRSIFYEHGGNATAGVQVHLFRYVIDTQDPEYVTRDGIRVYLGKWVDQGPLGLERPCDIKALLFSNADCNNFNNYYKFNTDVQLDNLYSSPDETITRDATCISGIYQHRSNHDPDPDQRFTTRVYDEETGLVKDMDVTDKVFYINEATGVLFMYNNNDKYDPKYGYGYKKIGWYPMVGGILK